MQDHWILLLSNRICQVKSPPLERMSLNSSGSELMQIDQICLLTRRVIAENFSKGIWATWTWEITFHAIFYSMSLCFFGRAWFCCLKKMNNSTSDKLGWLSEGIPLATCTFGKWDHTPDGKNCSPLFILTCHLDSSLFCPARDSGQSPPPRHSWFYCCLS